MDLNCQTRDLMEYSGHSKALQPTRVPTTETISYRVSVVFVQQLGQKPQMVTPLDCEWQLACGPDAIRVRVHYSHDLFSQESVWMFVDVFTRVLAAFASSPSISIARLPLCFPKDMENIREWNNTHKKPLEISSVGELFRCMTREAGDTLAVINSDRSLSLTFRQLDIWSDALAQWLLSEGCGGDKETIIGVWQSRSAILVVSYLACLKAGCAYMVRCFNPFQLLHTLKCYHASSLIHAAD